MVQFANTEFLLMKIYQVLKELRNYNGKLFCVRHKNRRKHNQHFKNVIFQTKFTHWHIKLNIYMQEIKFTSH